MNLRRGTREDVPVLDAIALAAKAHWGYSADQIALWQHDLRLRCFVAEMKVRWPGLNFA